MFPLGARPTNGANPRRKMIVTERTQIIALDSGPYLVKGPVVLLDADSNEFRAERSTFALCRCGGSQNKPFCDGTHKKIGFRATESAVREQQGVRS
jgi:CDGSH-type Zn-finger protein